MKPTFSKVYHRDGGPARVHGSGPRIMQSKAVREMLGVLHSMRQDQLNRKPKFGKKGSQ
jgi:hypothetical protein